MIRTFLDAITTGREAQAAYRRLIARGTDPARAVRQVFDGLCR